MEYVKRTIHFFKFDIGEDDSFKPRIFDVKPILEKLSNLSAEDKYLHSEDKRVICIIDSQTEPYKMRLANIRISDFPSIEEDGDIKPLEIPDHAGLFETIHIVFFPGNIIGFDNNFYGPRITKILEYFHKVAEEVCPQVIYLDPLINPKILEQLKRLKSIRLFNLKINSSYLDQISSMDESLGAALKSVRDLGNAEEIEIRIKVGPHSTNNLSKTLLGKVMNLMKNPDVNQELTKFIIKGFDESVTQNIELDLLNDKIIAKKQILKLDDRTKTLDWNSAYEAIISSYYELKEKMELAGTIRLEG
jgi:hypothetical protein